MRPRVGGGARGAKYTSLATPAHQYPFNRASVFQSVDPTNHWAIFRAYLDGVAAQAASAVVPNWIDRLGGADVYTLSNAYQLVESLRIDSGQLGLFGIHP